MHDCHAHIIGPAPHDPDWPHDTEEATLADYMAMLDANDIEKGVLVQPRAHGTDNSLILDAIRRYPDRLRGVAVVAPDMGVEGLRDLHRAGIRGVRLGGKVPVSALPAMAPDLARAGLHVQLLMRGDDIVTHRDAIADCPVPVVIDHLAHPDPAPGTDGAPYRTLSDLLDLGHVFAKLSAIYRYSERADWSDALPLQRDLARRHPERLVWGSDWPFLNQPAPGPTPPRLLAALRDAVAPEALARITETTPRVLYGF
ncbi:amidohydrolase family protein [Oceaniglobus trochenteri]|uniref:amidohydrolase family protein n=1 Tax=Oceaniglobus trochenteri TaxID=2763260 RepID=UPI001D00053A|nr:amidohydrolase family protein [Oceaniglobus trochenteri]